MIKWDIFIYIYILVGGLEHEFMTFLSVGNVIIPTDELIFFSEVGIPPTRIYIYTHDNILMNHILRILLYDNQVGSARSKLGSLMMLNTWGLDVV